MDLKPCPFYGKIPTLREQAGVFSIQCHVCAVAPGTPRYVNLEKAVKAWNTRHLSDTPTRPDKHVLKFCPDCDSPWDECKCDISITGLPLSDE